MAEVRGVDGACLLNSASFSVTNWTYEGSITLQEITTIGSTDKSYKPTTRDGSGTLVCTFNASDASQKVLVDMLLSSNTPGLVLLQLYQDQTSSDQLYFSAYVSNVSLPEGANDMTIMTASFQKTGNLYLVPTT